MKKSKKIKVFQVDEKQTVEGLIRYQPDYRISNRAFPVCSFTVRKDQSKKSGVTQRMKCVRKTMHSNQSPKHPRRQKAERK